MKTYIVAAPYRATINSADGTSTTSLNSVHYFRCDLDTADLVAVYDKIRSRCAKMSHTLTGIDIDFNQVSRYRDYAEYDIYVPDEETLKHFSCEEFWPDECERLCLRVCISQATKRSKIEVSIRLGNAEHQTYKSITCVYDRDGRELLSTADTTEETRKQQIMYQDLYYA